MTVRSEEGQIASGLAGFPGRETEPLRPPHHAFFRTVSGLKLFGDQSRSGEPGSSAWLNLLESVADASVTFAQFLNQVPDSLADFLLGLAPGDFYARQPRL